MSLELTPELKAHLEALLQSGALNSDSGDWTLVPNTRSQRMGPLHDLRIGPRVVNGKAYPAPLFVPSAQLDPNQPIHMTFPYPKLLWSQDGVEITVRSKAEEEKKLATGYLVANPKVDEILTPDQQLERLWATLSDEDKDFLRQENERQHRERMQKVLAGASQGKIESVVGAKRGPGRPRKVVNE